MSQGSARRRVVIVDDTALTAAGAEALLRPDTRVEVVATITHDEALAWVGWSSVDVVLLDAADTTKSDQFPGVAVVRAIRADAGRQPCVIVLTDRFAHPGLRQRLRDAKADFCFLREDVRTNLDLPTLVLEPERWRRTPPPLRRSPPQNLGIGPDSRVNEIIEYMNRYGLAEAWRAKGRARKRADNSHRIELQRLGRLAPVNLEGNPQRVARVPSIPQFLRVWDWATQPGPPD